MKTIPPPCPEPQSGQRYWRSLDQLAETPEFQQWVEREFPAGASEFTDPVGRRHFIKIMSASFLLAGLGVTGCRRPEEKILPFGKAPENYIHGVPQYYATAMPTRGSAIPLVVKSSDGRPTKIEGNKLHPDSNGGTDTFAQASILSLYDPDRAHRFTKGGNEVSQAEAFDGLKQIAANFSNNGGNGLAFLVECSSSPSRARLRGLIAQKFPQAQWVIYEPVDLSIQQTVATALGGQPLTPYYKLDLANVILSLDCDFIGSEQDTYIHCRNYAKKRRVPNNPVEKMNRLYSVEGLMTQTGMNADHRLRVPTSSVIAVAAAVAAQIVDDAQVKVLTAKFPLPANVKPEWIVECANDLKANQGASLVLAGYRQPQAVHVLTNLINASLQNNDKTVLFLNTLPRGGPPQEAATGTIVDLANALKAGQINTLVVLGGNPALNAPADLNWQTVQTPQNVVRLGYYEDESFAKTTWHFPMAHYLESWGDARTADGTVVPVQPLIAPLFGGVTELELLGTILGLPSVRPYDIVRETFRALAGDEDLKWKKFLHDGFLLDSALVSIGNPNFSNERVAAALKDVAAVPEPAKDKLEVVFHRDYKMDDGRWTNNGWLQELPDPVTKTVWDGLVLVSRRTAEELGLQNNDVVEINFNGTIKGPVWIQPGMADYSLGLALGYGRARGGTGRVGGGVGLYNAYSIRTTKAEYAAVGATLRKTRDTYKVSCTQEHGSMEGRPIIREGNLEQFRKEPKFAKNMDLEGHSEFISKDPKTGLPKMIYEHPYHAYETRQKQVGVSLKTYKFVSDVHQWGMSIDLNACVGCAACVMACQSENNVPIVGKDQVRRNREMHWLRIDRYYSGAYDKAPSQLIDDPQVVHQPMLCQHCENAPCESVCPVNATVHDEEGINVMAYNRCVGTRYCSNNCPYKVRRFNFFDYNKRPLNKLYYSPITTWTEQPDGKKKWELARWWNEPNESSNRPEDEWEILKLVKNPDVSVRMRGVMEKCTFCIQRIEQAKIGQKVKAGQSGDVRVPEGTFTTACAQACPTEAIVFGNLLDPKSRVAELKKQERDYTVLGFLDTRPRLTYLARVRNPNPKMPDYYETPLNIAEYEHAQGGGHAEHGGAGGEHGKPNEPKAHAPAEKGAH